VKHVLNVLVATAALLGMTATTASSSETVGRFKPRTLVAAKNIPAFAQDGNNIAWIDSSKWCDERKVVSRQVSLRNLATGVTVPLTRSNGPTCNLTRDLGLYAPQMALAGKRALWSYMTVSLSHFQVYLMSASPILKERTVGHFEIYGGFSDEDDIPPIIPMAGDGETLLFAGLDEGIPPTPTLTNVVLSSRSVPIKGTNNTVVLDTDADGTANASQRFIIQRVTHWNTPDPEAPWNKVPDGWVVETRFMANPRLVMRKFNMGKPAKAIASRPNQVALLTDDELQIRDWDGRLYHSVPIPKNAAPELGMEGWWVVFHVKRTIYVFDRHTKRKSVLTVADGKVNGLSIERQRVAWIEQRRGLDRIRAIDLPKYPY
jgi:hypothetical protein